MVAVDLRALVSKLNVPGKQALSEATALTVARTHYSVEIEHWLLKLVETTNSDVAAVLRYFGVDPGRVCAELNRVLDKLARGNTRETPFSPHLVRWMREAWSLASLGGNTQLVRSGHLLAVLLTDSMLSALAQAASRELARIPADQLIEGLAAITTGTIEDPSGAGARATSAAPQDTQAGSTPGLAADGALEKYTIDLTQRARENRIDPVLGRDVEIRQVIDILTRRRQNNPILTGEAGVGKTAVVEGFALRLAAGDVPPAMKNTVLRTLDLGLLQAGAGVKGEFENRLKSVIDEVRASPVPIILFIDEAHTLIGAGGAAGQNDAANLLKPALARGDLRTIAATTWAEYKKYFERDAALARRFQVVKVEEPDEGNAIAMLRGLVATLEKHHGVRVLDQAVVETVRLSKRYIPGRQLPDKGVSVLDTACARVSMSQNAVPAQIEDCKRRIDALQTEIGILSRESASGTDHSADIQRLQQDKARAEDEIAGLDSRWTREKELVARCRELRDKLEAGFVVGGSSQTLPEHERASLLTELADAQKTLADVQGEEPLLHPSVDGAAVAQVIANWTGIPLGRMVSNEIQTILNLKTLMEERIIGQPYALDTIARAVRTSRAKLTDPRKPSGVFLMVGTSGVGKTETALTLAELLYGGGQNLSVINMSEFKEEHKVSTLVGSPPGYVGYGEGGVLTEAVRRRPYSVVLLDEMEKAHPGVQDVFYQVFDKGQLRDGEGRDIDFKNTLIIMTSNAGTDTIAKLCADPETMPAPAALAEALRPDLLKLFKPAFLGRVTVVPYFPLSDATLRLIITLQLRRIRDRIADTYRAQFSWNDEVVEAIAARCTEAASGARNIENVLSHGVLPEISSRFLERIAKGDKLRDVQLSLDKDATFSYTIN
jgi:type VI secretion system protein VasG